jgi:hypothetical protein
MQAKHYSFVGGFNTFKTEPSKLRFSRKRQPPFLFVKNAADYVWLALTKGSLSVMMPIDRFISRLRMMVRRLRFATPSVRSKMGALPPCPRRALPGPAILRGRGPKSRSPSATWSGSLRLSRVKMNGLRPPLTAAYRLLFAELVRPESLEESMLPATWERVALSFPSGP